MIKTDTILNTAGDGYWSGLATAVKVLRIDIRMYGSMPEMRVTFDRRTWKCDRDGLIYSDKRFMRELRSLLRRQGLRVGFTTTPRGVRMDDVTYSEQGMQGDNYVSCDVSDAFFRRWTRKFSN